MIEEKLTGVSLKERHRSINNLVTAFTPEELTPELIASFTQGSKLDQLFLVKTANRMRNATIICEFLKSEDEFIVKKALEAKWFFELNSNKDMPNVEYFFQNIFPFATYYTRCQIISNLYKHLGDESLTEEFYTKITDIYNIKLAIKLLPACSEDFIKKQMYLGINVPILQMRQIYEKLPKLMIELLEDSLTVKNVKIYCVEFLFKLILRNDPKEFIRLYKSYSKHIKVKIGYQSTCQLLKIDRNFVIENSLTLLLYLNIEGVLKHLKGELLEGIIRRQFLDETYFPYNVLRIVKKWKPSYAALYLVNLYEKVFEKSVLHEDYLPHEYIEQLPVEMRTTWSIAMMSRKGNTEDAYLKYQSPEVAIKRYIDLSYIASDILKRTFLLKDMIDCCRIDNNTSELLKVMKYLLKRHRNDLQILRYSFFNHLQNSFKLYDLSADHWEIINELLNIMYYNNEVKNNYRQQFLYTVLKNKLRYHLNNDIEIESIIDKMIEYDIINFNMLDYFTDVAHASKVFDTIFSKYKSFIIDKPLTEDVTTKIICLLNGFEEWNKHHPKNKRCVLECYWLMEVIKMYLKADRDCKRVAFILWNDIVTRKMFANDIFKIVCKEEVVQNMLSHDIQTLVSNVGIYLDESTKSCSIANYSKQYHKIKTYLWKPLGEIMFEKITEILENNQVTELKPDSIGAKILSKALLMNANDYDNVYKKYAPISTKMKFVTNDQKEEYQRTEILIRKAKILNPPISYDTILLYSKDYLKFALPSLLSMCYKKKEIDTVNFVSKLSKMPVSVKKHSIRLAFFLYPKHDILPFYKTMWDGEKNVSIREVLFAKAFKIFSSEIDKAIERDAWTLIKCWIESFKEADMNLFDYLTRVDKVRDDYINDFCETSWKALNILSGFCKMDFHNHKINLIYGCTRKIDLLREEFCEIIINEYLVSVNIPNDALSESLLNFCVNYVIKAKFDEIQEKRISNISAIFKTFISHCWIEKRNNSSKYAIEKFINNCYRLTLEGQNTLDPIPILNGLSSLLKSVLPYESVLKLHLSIELTIIFHECYKRLKLTGEEGSDLLVYQFVENIVPYLDKLTEKYGSEVYYLYLPIIKEFATTVYPCYKFIVYGSTNIKTFYLKALLKYKTKSRHLFLLIIELMEEQNNNADLNNLQQMVINEVKNYGDLTIKMILNDKISLSHEEVFTFDYNLHM